MVMKEKYPVSGFTRDKEAIYVNGIHIFVSAEYNNFKAAIPKKRHKALFLVVNDYWNEIR
jgi:hypothetical protein